MDDEFLARFMDTDRDSEGTSPVIVILYDDLATALRAKRALDLLPSATEGEGAPQVAFWKLELLSDPILAHEIAAQAAAADVLLLSLHDREQLDAGLQAWLKLWLDQRDADQACALGLLMDRKAAAQGRGHPVVSWFEALAGHAGADLFFGFAETPATAADETTFEEIHNRVHSSSTVLDTALRQVKPPREWGLNE
jgi:hypothetical protein